MAPGEATSLRRTFAEADDKGEAEDKEERAEEDEGKGEEEGKEEADAADEEEAGIGGERAGGEGADSILQLGGEAREKREE
jgi:hypothetical protein